MRRNKLMLCCFKKLDEYMQEFITTFAAIPATYGTINKYEML